MNNSLQEGEELIKQLLENENFPSDVESIVIPPYILLEKAVELCKNSPLKVGAQNCSNYNKGAYTGEISAEMIKSCGASFVIVGHSERRSYFNESNKELKDKISICLSNGLTPIFCVGETLEERNQNIHFDIIKTQLEEVIFDLSAEHIRKLILAYEPVWAIGTGKTASSEQAQEVHAFIRNLLSQKYSSELANELSILYGGSCKPSNAKELFSQPDIDGGLIGGASLNAADFSALINSF